jgi:hypothetical protein
MSFVSVRSWSTVHSYAVTLSYDLSAWLQCIHLTKAALVACLPASQ